MYHVHEQCLGKCIKEGYVEGISVQKVTKLSYYKGFMAGKLYRKPFPSARDTFNAATTASAQ